MSAVELADGKQIKRRGEQTDPRGAAHGMQEQVRGMRVRLENRRHQLQDQWHAKDDIRISIERDRWNHMGVKHTISQRRKGEQEIRPAGRKRQRQTVRGKSESENGSG